MKSLCSAFLLLLVAGMGTAQTATAYKAGAASVVITPEKNLPRVRPLIFLPRPLPSRMIKAIAWCLSPWTS